MSLYRPFAVLGLLIFAVTSWAAPQARIMRTIDSRQATRIEGGVHPLAQAEFDQGALDPSQMLTHVTMFFSRTAAQQQALDQLLQEQQDPTSAKYHQWLTPEEFGAQFGMAKSDLAKVQDWLVSQGFSIDTVARGGDFIAFSGSVGQINSGFRTEMHQYNVNGELHFANAIAPAVPNAMSDVVVGFRGLNDFKPRARVKSRKVDPRLTSGLSGNHFMVPDDFQTIYNLKSVYSTLTDGSSHALDGTGQSVAVIGQVAADATLLTDVATFRSLSGLPATTVQVVGSSTGNDSGDLGETALDLEWVGATAPGAHLIFVTAGDAFTALTNAVNSNVAPVISISYGLCEFAEGTPPVDENTISKAASQGQTVVGPAGDNGAADCDYSTSIVTVAKKGLFVDFPASSPFATGIGGTTFNDASGTYWSTTNNALNGTALSYIPEVVWNDTSSTVGLAATGGGVSVLFSPKPVWQTGTGVPNDGARDVPDIAFAASPSHDEFITCSEGSCAVCYPGSAVDPGATVTPPGTGAPDANCPSVGSPGYRQSSSDPNVNNTFNVVGGTSAGVPTFAGVVALINQKMGASQGLLNPRLYQLAASAAGSYIYHDVTSGNNIVPCTPGTPALGGLVTAAQQCPGSGSFGYTAGVGYDQTTGLGSVDAYNLITNWSGAGTPDFAVSFFNSPITLTHGTSTTIPLMVQPLNGFSSTVSLSCSSTIPGVTCSVPSTTTPGSPVTVTVTAASVVTLDKQAPSPFIPYWQYSFGLAAFFVMGKKRGKRQIAAIAAVAVILIAAMPSCGGGGGGGGNSNVVTPPSLSLSPTSLTFNYVTGGSAPAAQTFSVGSSGTALSYTVSSATTSGGSWLSASSTNTSTPGTVNVSVNPSSLAAGTYNGTVTVSPSGASNGPQTVGITLNVTNAGLTLSQGSLSFSYQIGGSVPAAQNVNVGSTGSAVNYSVAASTLSGGNWLSATPASGTTPGSASVSVSPSGLAVGSYSGSVSVSSTNAANSPQNTAVILNVTAQGSITVTATSGAITHNTQLAVTVN